MLNRCASSLESLRVQKPTLLRMLFGRVSQGGDLTGEHLKARIMSVRVYPWESGKSGHLPLRINLECFEKLSTSLVRS